MGGFAHACGSPRYCSPPDSSGSSEPLVDTDCPQCRHEPDLTGARAGPCRARASRAIPFPARAAASHGSQSPASAWEAAAGRLGTRGQPLVTRTAAPRGRDTTVRGGRALAVGRARGQSRMCVHVHAHACVHTCAGRSRHVRRTRPAWEAQGRGAAPTLTPVASPTAWWGPRTSRGGPGRCSPPRPSREIMVETSEPVASGRAGGREGAPSAPRRVAPLPASICVCRRGLAGPRPPAPSPAQLGTARRSPGWPAARPGQEAMLCSLSRPTLPG